MHGETMKIYQCNFIYMEIFFQYLASCMVHMF